MAPKTLTNGQQQTNGQSAPSTSNKGARSKKAKRQTAGNEDTATTKKEALPNSLLASAKPIITASKEPTPATTLENSDLKSIYSNESATNTFEKQQKVPTKTTTPTSKSNQITTTELTRATPVVATKQESIPARNMSDTNSDNKSHKITAITAAATSAITSQQTAAVNAAENESLSSLINNMTNDSMSDCVSVTSKTSSARISTIDPEEGVKIDTSRVQRRFSSQNSQEESSTCKICSKHVYQMERMMAEKNVYHKQCFRCSQCKIQLRMDNYSSHESQVYCKAHHKQLSQPRAKFDEENDVELVTKSRGRWKQMIICENEPAELPKDVVRCDTKVDDGIESLNLNLGNIREKFEHQAIEQPHQKISSPIIDKPSINIKQTLANLQQNSLDKHNSSGSPLSSPAVRPPTLVRSESLMMRLKKYESVMSGEMNDDDSSGESSNEAGPDNGGDGQPDNGRSDIASVDLSSLKQKWESGHVNKNREELAHEHKEELSKVRQSLAFGRNQSVKKIYEKAVQEAVSSKPQKSESVVLNFPSKANSLKEKFELGLVNDGDSDADEPSKLDQLRQEKMNDLSVFDEGETSAREARNMFKQIDRRLSSESQQKSGSFDGKTTSGLSNAAGEGGYQSLGSKGALINGSVTAAARRRFERRPVRSNTVADFGDNKEPIEVVKCSQPGAKEDISVETTRLREKFNFFENYREETKTPRRFEMTPPREILTNGRKYSTVANCDSSSDEENTNANDTIVMNGDGPKTNGRVLSRRKSSSGSNRLANGHHINGGQTNGYAASNNYQKNSNDENDDGIVKCSVTSKLDDVPKTDTTRRMLDKFKQLEENNNTNTINNNNNPSQPIYVGNLNTNINLIKQNLLSPASAEVSKDGGRPCLKRITPPREYTLDSSSSDDDDSSDIQQRDPNIVRYADKVYDQIQVEPEKARSLRMKFENWAANQSQDNDDNNNNVNGYEQFVPSVDTARNLKAKFEAFGREEKQRPTAQARVNRFVAKDFEM